MKALILVILLFTFQECYAQSDSYRIRERKKIEKCRKKWVYKDLKSRKEIVVLFFAARERVHSCSFPNFIIGATEDKDTIALVDIHFEGSIEVGKKIDLLPYSWNKGEKVFYKPEFTVSNIVAENDLMCAVKTVYYGKIK